MQRLTLRVSTTGPLLVVIALMMLGASAATCQSPPFDAFDNKTGESQNDTRTKVGWFLEQEFQKYLQNKCAVQPLKFGQRTLSSIPVPVVVALGGVAPDSLVWHWVFLPRTYSAADGFRMISRTQTLPPTTPDPTYLLPLDALQDPETMLLAGTSSTLFSTNCTGIITAAARVDSNINFLTASLKAAAAADYQNTDQAELGLIKGDFNSPFLTMYGGNDGDTASLYAHLTLWNWYRNHPTLRPSSASPLYMLHWFNGYTLYQVDKKARSVDGSMSVSADVHYLGFVNADGNLSGQYKDYGSTTVHDYEFAVGADESSQQQYQFDVLDDVDAISTWSKTQPVTGTFNALPQFSKVLRKGNSDSAQHEQIITGMPPSLCSTNVWALDPEQTAQLGTLTLKQQVRPIRATATQPPGCAFTLDFVPKSELMNAPNPIALNYSFKTSIGTNSFVINAGEVDFQTSAFPQLAPKLVGRVPVQVEGTNLQWSLIENVEDDPSLATPDQVTSATKISGPTLSNCTAGTGQFDVPADGISTAGSGHQLTILLQQDFSIAASMPDISAGNLTSCNVSMRLHLLMRSGRTADVDLPANTVLAYPKLGTVHFQIRISPNTLRLSSR